MTRWVMLSVFLAAQPARAGEAVQFGIANVYVPTRACVQSDHWQPKAGEQLRIATFEPLAVHEAGVTESPSEFCTSDWSDPDSGTTFLVRIQGKPVKLGDWGGIRGVAIPRLGKYELLNDGRIRIQVKGIDDGIVLRQYMDADGQFFVAEHAGKVVWKSQDGFFPVRVPRSSDDTMRRGAP